MMVSRALSWGVGVTQIPLLSAWSLGLVKSGGSEMGACREGPPSYKLGFMLG